MKNRCKKLVLIFLLTMQPVKAIVSTPKLVNIVTATIATGGVVLGYYSSKKKNVIGEICGLTLFTFSILIKGLSDEMLNNHFFGSSFFNLKRAVHDIEKSLDNGILCKLENQGSIIDFAMKEFVFDEYPVVASARYLEKLRSQALSIDDLCKEIGDEQQYEEYVEFIKTFDVQAYVEKIDALLSRIKTSDIYLKQVEPYYKKLIVKMQFESYKKEQASFQRLEYEKQKRKDESTGIFGYTLPFLIGLAC